MFDVVAVGETTLGLVLYLLAAAETMVGGAEEPFAEKHRAAAAPVVNLLEEVRFDSVGVIIDADDIEVFLDELEAVSTAVDRSEKGDLIVLLVSPLQSSVLPTRA